MPRPRPDLMSGAGADFLRRVGRPLAFALVFSPLGSALAARGAVVDIDPVPDAAVGQALKLNDNLETLLGASSDPKGVDAIIEPQRRRLADIVRSFGYLNGDVRIETTGAGADLKLRIIATLGERFRLALVEVDGLEGLAASDATKIDIGQYLLRFPGRDADARSLLEIEDDILRRVRANVDPTARIVARALSAEPHGRLATFKIRIGVGGPGAFGPVVFSGASGMDVGKLENLRPFAIGESYDPQFLVEYRRRLGATGLFSQIKVEPSRERDLAGRIPIQVSVTPNRPDPAKLAQTGRRGFIVTAVSLVALACRQGIVVARGRGALLRWVDPLVAALVIASVAFIALRFVSLLGAD